jgi:hypothetical protein
MLAETNGNPGSCGHRLKLELMLLMVTVGTGWLFYQMGPNRMIMLSLFFLPVVLSGYFLGRTTAGVLAFLTTIVVSLVVYLRPGEVATLDSPLAVGLAIAVWASVLGLTAILVGTLCEEQARKNRELHDAYIGVVEVLTRYLQSSDPRVKARSLRVAHLSQRVAEELHLSAKEADDIRVGALLHDLGNVEITIELINKAVSSLSSPTRKAATHHFHGMDLVRSLSGVLRGAVPLVMSQEDTVREYLLDDDSANGGSVPIGAQIIRTVRAFDELVFGASDTPQTKPEAAIRELGDDITSNHQPAVLRALESVAVGCRLKELVAMA